MSINDEFMNTLRDWIEISTQCSIHAFHRHNRESALSLSQIGTLIRLYHHGPSPINELADHLGVTMAAVSQLLNPLIDLDLIIRSTNPEDRRVKLIKLTEKGKATVEESISSRTAWIDDLADKFSPQEKETIFPVIEIMKHRLQALLALNDPKCHHNVDPLPEGEN
jgi:DNA-binding MarR family transcriptional regulator